MSDEMGTTTTVLTESESRLAGTEQVKHTPGPWTVTEIDEWAHVSSSPDGFGDVCTAWSSHGNAEANARLIAAAPDMLAALRTVGDVLSRKHLTKKDDELWAAFSQVVAAVFKAEGRAP